MKIKYKVGDLIEAAKIGEVNVIAHQANCFCTGKRGIAPLLFSAFPELKEADDGTERGEYSKLGKISFFIDQETGLIGFNLYGQYHCLKDHPEYGTQYWALDSALIEMRDMLESYVEYPPEKLRIGFPLIGCGLAGGDWKVVSALIEDAFKDYACSITVYTLEKVEGLCYDLA